MSTAAVAIPGLAQALARRERTRHVRAFALALPLLAFLLFALLVPIAALLLRAVQNPEVAHTLPRTVQALAGWDGRELPAAGAYAALAQDLSQLPDGSQAGTLSRRLNTDVAGSRSLVMKTYRAMPL